MNERIISLITTGGILFQVGVDSVELIEAVNPPYKYRPHEGFYRVVYEARDAYIPFHAVQLISVDEGEIEEATP